MRTDFPLVRVKCQAFLPHKRSSAFSKKPKIKCLKQKNLSAVSLELVALADRIKVLNDDDALELLKKRMLSSSASFMEW